MLESSLQQSLVWDLPHKHIYHLRGNGPLETYFSLMTMANCRHSKYKVLIKPDMGTLYIHHLDK